VAAKEPSDLGGRAIPKNVTLRFNTGHDETNQLVAGARLHVVPLLDSGHSAGQSVLLRAMAQGKAVVVTDTAGIRDYVRDSETAVLVPPGDAVALRTAIVRLWGDTKERSRIGGTAARIQRQDFGFPRLTQRLVKIAEEVLQASKLRS
jgi:glycosyltransferase involved in cell wall biosynthesis